MSDNPAGPHRKRLKRAPVAGQARELTFSCERRLPLLSRDRTCEWLAEAIARVREQLDIALLAYVFMPEHVHLLVYPRRDPGDIPRFLKRVKQSVSIRARDWLQANDPAWLDRLTRERRDGRRRFRFWQAGGGYDRNVDSELTLLRMIEYIHQNPVRRGLVERPEDWPWSSAGWYLTRREGPLLVDDVRE